ncbi:MAG TPA: class I SAM-dependent methyltransferase, partial [Bacteroidota bacterium]|nr:class I SAM-dependent methyltransferase [Bacteroidota bacterium]
MLTALLQPSDARQMFDKVRTRGASVLTNLFRGRTGRTAANWDQTDTSTRQWTAIPVLQERIRLRVTGDPHVNIPAYIRGKYGQEDTQWRALSLGCGTGRKELAWFTAGGLSQLDAYDLSGKRIAEAQRLAAAAGMEKQVRFIRGDVRYLQLRKHAYDLIILDDALHHFTPLQPILQNIFNWLAPHGLLVVNEFVGPTRFQWTDHQIEIANALIEETPARFNLRPDGTPRPPVRRMGTLAMIMYDPSEAVESSSILPSIHKMFSVQEESLYGGALLHLVFKDIAHHFLQPDDEALAYLRRCMDAEDEAMQR